MNIWWAHVSSGPPLILHKGRDFGGRRVREGGFLPYDRWLRRLTGASCVSHRHASAGRLLLAVIGAAVACATPIAGAAIAWGGNASATDCRWSWVSIPVLPGRINGAIGVDRLRLVFGLVSSRDDTSGPISPSSATSVGFGQRGRDTVLCDAGATAWRARRARRCIEPPPGHLTKVIHEPRAPATRLFEFLYPTYGSRWTEARLDYQNSMSDESRKGSMGATAWGPGGCA